MPENVLYLKKKESVGVDAYTSWGSGDANSQDANTAPLGLIWCRRSVVQNLPGTSTYGFLHTEGRITKSSVQMLLQTFTEYSNSGATGYWVRYYCNSKWYPWVNTMA